MNVTITMENEKKARASGRKERQRRTKRNITNRMATTMRKLATKLLNHLLQGPSTAERRGEYERKKMGTGRNATTSQTTFFGLCVIIRTIVAPNATAIIETERTRHIIPCLSFLNRYILKSSKGNEDVRMEKNIPTDVKAKAREITSAKTKTIKKGLE